MGSMPLSYLSGTLFTVPESYRDARINIWYCRDVRTVALKIEPITVTSSRNEKILPIARELMQERCGYNSEDPQQFCRLSLSKGACLQQPDSSADFRNDHSKHLLSLSSHFLQSQPRHSPHDVPTNPLRV